MWMRCGECTTSAVTCVAESSFHHHHMIKRSRTLCAVRGQCELKACAVCRTAGSHAAQIHDAVHWKRSLSTHTTTYPFLWFLRDFSKLMSSGLFFYRVRGKIFEKSRGHSWRVEAAPENIKMPKGFPLWRIKNMDVNWVGINYEWNFFRPKNVHAKGVVEWGDQTLLKNRMSSAL